MSMSLADRRASSTAFQGVELVANMSTLYRSKDDVRFGLAIETISACVDQDIPPVIVDFSSAKGHSWVEQEFRRVGGLVIPTEIGGIAMQRRQAAAFSIRHGAEKVASFEPEKMRMPSFKNEIVEALGRHAFLSVGRTEAAKASLPPVQRRTEALGGWIFEKILQLPHDPWSGGRGFTPEGAEYVRRYPAEHPGMNNWLWLYKTMLDARTGGAQIGGIDVDLLHPQAMTDEETNNQAYDTKRYKQFVLQVAWGIKQRNYILLGEEQQAQDLALAMVVAASLRALPNNSTNHEYEACISDLEKKLQAFGYSTLAA